MKALPYLERDLGDGLVCMAIYTKEKAAAEAALHHPLDNNV